MMHSVEKLQLHFENALQEYIQNLSDDSLHEPIRYILNLGGKRVRPVLVMLAGEAFGAPVKATVSSALAVELFHNFSLMHDDIMDDAPIRRGQSTVHEKWNSNAAILSGDAMMIEAYRQLACADPKHLTELLDLFNTTSIEVCRGQQLDMDFEKLRSIGVEDYIEMIRLKTAVLLGCSLKMGAIVANATKTDAAAVYEFGMLAGLAFQIQDDYLDAFGDPEKFGKQRGGDILANKKTFLVIRALEKADEFLRKELESIYFGAISLSPDDKISRVLDIFAQLDIRSEAEKESEKYFLSASANLSKLSLSDERKIGLQSFLEDLQLRKR